MIVIKNLSFHYKKDMTILDNIHASLLPGHIYGLLGLNGVGKTTFLKLICGLLFPRSGNVDISGFTPEDRQIGFLQDIYFVTDEVDLPYWNIVDYLEIYSPLYPKFDKAYFDEILISLQVDPRENIKALSYGQRKKVNIAFALATNTKLLLMDEPTNGLDIPAKTQFRKALAKHVSEDTTVIISTHQIRDIHQLIDHLLVLQNRNLTLNESIDDLSRKIKFKQGDYPETLYVESSLNGNSNILLNTDGEETPFDIELFFNALINEPQFLKKLSLTNLQAHE
ncbi:ABC transporter ATP-binding protein [Sphingobacterium chuzhouense]|uniref:ABC transporter ATP-binding protein n=1 Tax=Sphingobacterium chuzhouense TaxID=1742264 RepID=A0ABR7XWT0_9SPHI|nr:ABC transporter ATP-binding protein [Sphingobacterium chuzhouense]MBD1423492.1 ABC transporter ATP-binding protein [Sphingobacterium chuzhouense]